MNKLPTFLLLILIVSCASTELVVPEISVNENISNEKSEVQKIAEENYGERYALEENSEKTHVIIKSSFKDIRELLPEVYFLVYENKSNTIIHSDTLNAGFVAWEGSRKVKAIERNIQGEDGSTTNHRTYYFDVIDLKINEGP